MEVTDTSGPCHVTGTKQHLPAQELFAISAPSCYTEFIHSVSHLNNPGGQLFHDSLYIYIYIYNKKTSTRSEFSKQFYPANS